MSIKPILMGTPTAKALAEGRKSQTRRKKGLEEINKDPDIYQYKGLNNSDKHVFARMWKGNYVESHHPKPQYNKGDILWVRETWFPTRYDYKDMINRGLTHFVKFRADGDYDPKTDCVGRSWKPSIYMPKIVCRRFLEVTDVRVERLQDISEEDAIAEGVERTENYWESKGARNYMYGTEKGFRHEWFFEDSPYGIENTPSVNGIISSFFTLIASIHSWELLQSNPWVWVYEFKEVERPKNFLD